MSQAEALRAALAGHSLDVLGISRGRGAMRVVLTAEEIALAAAHGIRLERRSDRYQLDTDDLDAYRDPREMRSALEALAARHPQLVKLWEFGRGHRGRSLLAVEISAHLGDDSRPVILFDGQHHARELMTGEVVLHIAESLAASHQRDPEVQRWLEQFRIVVVPQVNPDGAAIVFDEDRSWRKNARQLRNSTVGVDLNRNHVVDWAGCDGSSGHPEDDDYRGPAAASEPETRAMMELIRQLRPVAGISYHSVSELVLIPFGCPQRRNDARRLFLNIGAQIASGIVDDAGRGGTYAVGTPADLLYPADGGIIDWAWRDEGMLAFAIEVNSIDTGQQPDFRRWRDVTVRRQEGGWQRLLRRLERTSVRALVWSASGGQVTFTLRAGSAADVAPAPRRLRGQGGLLFETVAPGDYRVELFVDGRSVRSLDVRVSDRMVDLGFIAL